MCVAAMERRLQSGMSFLDFGTGSGILSVVAHHLGATPIYATEIDSAVAEFAQRVWELNGVPAQLIPLTANYTPHRLELPDARFVFETTPPDWTASVDEIIPDPEGELPEVDFCVANVGDHFWDQRHRVKAATIINISNAGKEVVVHA